MENKMIFLIVTVIIIGMVTVFKLYNTGEDEKIDMNNCICFYYRFAGNIDWIKNQIERYRFDAFKYLIPCRNREESDFYIVVSDVDKEIKLNFYATEFNYSKRTYLTLLVENLKVSDEQYDHMLDYLKDTYMESGENSSSSTGTEGRI